VRNPGVWLCTVEDVNATDVTLKKLPARLPSKEPQLGAGDVTPHTS